MHQVHREQTLFFFGGGGDNTRQKRERKKEEEGRKAIFILDGTLEGKNVSPDLADDSVPAS